MAIRTFDDSRSYVELFSSRGKDPLSSAGQRANVAERLYSRDIRGYAFAVKQPGTSIMLPANGQTRIKHRFLVLQLYVASGDALMFTVAVQGNGSRYRLLFSTSWHQPMMNALHARLPLAGLPRGIWSNLCLDLSEFTQICFHETYRRLDWIRLHPSCTVRNVFTMRARPEAFISSDADNANLAESEPIPCTLQFPGSTEAVSHLIRISRDTEQNERLEHAKVVASRSKCRKGGEAPKLDVRALLPSERKSKPSNVAKVLPRETLASRLRAEKIRSLNSQQGKVITNAPLSNVKVSRQSSPLHVHLSQTRLPSASPPSLKVEECVHEKPDVSNLGAQNFLQNVDESCGIPEIVDAARNVADYHSEEEICNRDIPHLDSLDPLLSGEEEQVIFDALKNYDALDEDDPDDSLEHSEHLERVDRDSLDGAASNDHVSPIYSPKKELSQHSPLKKSRHALAAVHMPLTKENDMPVAGSTVDVLYDPILDCYYDPRTRSYYTIVDVPQYSSA